MTIETVMWLILAAAFVAVVSLGLKQLKPARGLVPCALLGVLGLTAIHFTSMYTGVDIGINGFTASVSAVLGLPGVITMLALKLLII